MNRRDRSRPLMLALLVALTASCSGGTTDAVFFGDGFSVRAESGRLVLWNRSTAPIHYVAMERDMAALVDLHPDPETWPRLGPGEEAVIHYGELMGWEPGDSHALVYWWSAGRYGDTAVIRLR